MTKGKRPVALYEVIHRDKRFAGLKRKNPGLIQLPPAPATSQLIDKSVAFKPAPAAKPARKPTKDLIAPYLQKLRTAWPKLQRLGPILVKLRSKIIEQSPVLGGTLTALIVIACISVARHYTHATPNAYASLDGILDQTPDPKVLDLTGLDRHTPAVAELPFADADAEPAASVSVPAVRTINLNYMLVQCYRDEKTATDARDFLDKNGIPCTIEREVRDWHKGYYYVVGLQGFPRITSPDYLAYRTRIEDLSTEFSPHNVYKGFAPQAVKWDRAE
jgi:hypothetical protein